MTLARSLRLLLVALVGMTLAACGGGSEGSGTVGDIVFSGDANPRIDTGDDRPGGKDIGEPKETGPTGWDTGGEPEGPRYEIVFLVEDPLIVPAGGAAKVTVLVLDYDDGRPAADAHIVLHLEPLDGGDGSLDAGSVFTGANGRAEFRFRANTAAPAEYRVTATAVGARSDASLNIRVEAHPKGALRVQLTYDGSLPLTDIQIGLVEAQGFQCSQYYPPAPPAALESRTVLSITSPPTLFEDLPAGTYYSVWVTAKSRSTGTNLLRLTAAGCADGAYVEVDSESLITVDLYDLVLNPAGLYDMISVFDFTDAIPGEVGEIINLIVDAFWDPGKFVFDMVITVVDLYLGQLVGQVVEWALSLFRDQLEEAINNWVFNDSPQWVQDIFQVGQDITQIVANLEMLADLRIAKLTNDYYVQGEEDWHGIALYWHLGCPEETDLDFDPDCGRLVLSMEDIQNTAFPMDLVQGVWTGTIANFDRLDIQTHRIQLNYGRLILFVLNELLLPAISNGQYHDLRDAVIGFVDCPNIAGNVVGDFLEALGIDQDEVAGFCEDAIGWIVDPIVLTIYGLGADSRVRLFGTALLVDDNDDLIVDRIIDGEWTGYIELDQGGGNTGGQFTGEWEATRQ